MNHNGARRAASTALPFDRLAQYQGLIYFEMKKGSIGGHARPVAAARGLTGTTEGNHPRALLSESPKRQRARRKAQSRDAGAR